MCSRMEVTRWTIPEKESYEKQNKCVGLEISKVSVGFKETYIIMDVFFSYLPFFCLFVFLVEASCLCDSLLSLF